MIVEEIGQAPKIEHEEETVECQVEVPQIQRRPSQQPVETIVDEKAGGRRRLEKGDPEKDPGDPEKEEET